MMVSMAVFKFHRALYPCSIAILLIAGIIGCSRGIELIPVSGEVQLNGKPLADCSVTFSPVAGGPAASGVTDMQGCFQLSSANRSGAVPGEHRVTIAKKKTHLISDPTGAHSDIRVEWFTPEKYSHPETSGLQKTVSSQEHDFVFELSSK